MYGIAKGAGGSGTGKGISCEVDIEVKPDNTMAAISLNDSSQTTQGGIRVYPWYGNAWIYDGPATSDVSFTVCYANNVSLSDGVYCFSAFDNAEYTGTVKMYIIFSKDGIEKMRQTITCGTQGSISFRTYFKSNGYSTMDIKVMLYIESGTSFSSGNNYISVSLHYLGSDPFAKMGKNNTVLFKPSSEGLPYANEMAQDIYFTRGVTPCFATYTVLYLSPGSKNRPIMNIGKGANLLVSFYNISGVHRYTGSNGSGISPNGIDFGCVLSKSYADAYMPHSWSGLKAVVI